MATVEEQARDQRRPPARSRSRTRRPARSSPRSRAGAAEQVAELVARARAAQPGWEALGFEGRGRILRRAQKWVVDNAERVIADDRLRDRQDLRGRAARRGRATAPTPFGFWAKNAPKYLADEKVTIGNPFVKGRKLVVRYRPLGVVGVIGPWNYPLTNSFGDCIPALAAGNAVDPQAREVTPLTSLLMAEVLRECGLPEDVFQVAAGERLDVGERAHRRRRHGHVHRLDRDRPQGHGARGADADPGRLELGGKDPMIVLADADLERAANARGATTSMQNGGQTCISVERVYVEEPVYDEFVAKVDREGARAAPGRARPARRPSTSARSPPRRRSTSSTGHVQDAVAKGARVLVGGQRGDDGPRRLLRADACSSTSTTRWSA